MTEPQPVSQPPTSTRLRSGPRALAAVAFAVLAVATAMMLQRIEPFTTWYYSLAWYPTLVLIDCAIAMRTGSYHVISRPAFAVSLLAWSAVTWFVFELLNFRIQNWYYVNLPANQPVRWAGIAVAFMTVLPAIFLGERWLEMHGVARRVRWKPLNLVGPRALGLCALAGLLFVVLTLIWPRAFYPLAWGALTLLLEPWNCGRDPSRSLLADLAAGRPGRILRLLVAGLAIGFIWELYNVEARSKWIYTVPGLEELKLFEMPLLGFLGFPVFALDCFVVYQTLTLAGVAVPRKVTGSRSAGRLRRGRTLLAGLLAAAFCLVTLQGMERWTIDSYAPKLEELWLIDAPSLACLRDAELGDPFRLAAATPTEVTRACSSPLERARSWVAAARLATLRGIGTANARLLWHAGVRSVQELSEADAEALSSRLRAMTDRPRAATPARVRVWIRAARARVPV